MSVIRLGVGACLMAIGTIRRTGTCGAREFLCRRCSIVGGSGITFALAAVQDLIQVRVIDGWHQRDLEGPMYVSLFSLPCTHNNTNANASLPQPAPPRYSPPFIQQSTRAPLKISVHYTRAADVPPAKDFLPGLTLTAGRPRIAKVLDAVIARAVSYGYGVKAGMDITGVVVGVCGPVGLGDEVSQAVSAVDPGRRWAVGGIEMYEETFGW
ncbi:hypothetical protein BU15DRAFT_61629 [Melanogaster broomeanus]|nr:hypothetical protein BU15DRAFT_61629 [Melanogaster broomeanus]